MAVASMNPNKPDIDLPVSIFELRELPGLIRDVGGLLLKRGGKPKNVAKANLIAEFGIKPLVSDLMTLLQFTEKVANREAQLREMAKGSKRFTRKLSEESWQRYWEGICFPSAVLNSSVKAHGEITGQMDRVYWFTARAKLLDVISERDINTRAFRIVLGLDTPSLATIWNSLPWTWLIDWFFTLGTLLSAHRGGLRWEWEGINVMHLTTYRMSIAFPNIPVTHTVSPELPQTLVTEKYRDQASGWSFPQFRTPYLTGREWGILMSLLALRF